VTWKEPTRVTEVYFRERRCCNWIGAARFRGTLHAGEAVIKTRLHSLDRIPANDTGWPLKIHHRNPCGFREQPLDASCDPRANHAAKIFAVG